MNFWATGVCTNKKIKIMKNWVSFLCGKLILVQNILLILLFILFEERSCKLSVIIACSETVKLDIAGYFELELDIIIGYS